MTKKKKKKTFFPDNCVWCIHRHICKHSEIIMPDKFDDIGNRTIQEDKEKWIEATRVIQEFRGKYCYFHKREKGLG